jgi:NAD(P)-dependent dehydrogenase (short-subunit alcohol dehydrogenase family)
VAAETEDYGISVFAIHPGGVKSALTAAQYLTEGARKWYPEIYDYCTKGGAGQPPELAGQLVVFLASGRADTLSGCFISVDDDVVEMVSHAEDIQKDELYRLRLRT